MDILAYFKEVNAQKQLNKLSKKYQNKKIVIYGAGVFFKTLLEHFDLSGLNIVAICDKKFEESKEENPSKYNAITPNELKEYEMDAILVALNNDLNLCYYLENKLLIDTQNDNKDIEPIIEPTFIYTLKVLLGIIKL